VQQQLEYRAMLAVDIERSSGRGNVALLQIRDVLTTLLHDSLEQSGIDWETCHRTDLGDGIRVIAPAAAAKPRLIHPLLHELVVRLRAHNRTAGQPTQIRVRIALHAGDVYLGPAGEAAGQPLEVLARMLDAPPSRVALAQAPPTTPASVLISQHFYDETVRHGYPGIDVDTFHRVTFTEKNYTADAWLFLPESSAGPQNDTPQTTDVDQPRGRSTMVNNASGRGVVYATQNGTQNIHPSTQP